MRPSTTFNNNSIPLNSFGFLAPDAHRSPDARWNPGLPTDQPLTPPAIPARADIRLKFTRGFGLDVPDEAEEEDEEIEPRGTSGGGSTRTRTTRGHGC